MVPTGGRLHKINSEYSVRQVSFASESDIVTARRRDHTYLYERIGLKFKLVVTKRCEESGSD